VIAMRSAVLLLLSLPLLASDKRGGLIEAVQRHDIETVRNLIQGGVDVNVAEADGTTALHYAAHLDDAAIVDLLLRAGAQPMAVNQYGANALSEAAAAGDASLAEKLLAAGASAASASPEGETVLMTAARTGNAGFIRLLLERGARADTHESWKGQTALMWAAAGNHAEAAKILIEHDASVNARSALVTPEVKRPANGNLVSEQPKGGLTPLLFAAREGALESVRVLIGAGADLNLAEPDGITPLIIAIINGHYDVAGALLEGGANVNIADKWGRTPLYAAVDMNTLEPSTTRPKPPHEDRLTALDIVRATLKRGASVNVRLVAAAPGRGIPDGPDPLLREGTTPFIRAAKTGDVTTMRLLLNHGADPGLTTNQSVNALMAAAGQGWRFGDSQIPESDALEGVKLCLELGLDVNAVNARKETALHGAADRGAEKIVQYLVDHGAMLDAKDEGGHTPLDAATGGDFRGHPGYPGTAALLRSLRAQKN
jgi:ankyrin repeat protein